MEKFVSDNFEILEWCQKLASDKQKDFLGFGNCSRKEAFDYVLNDKNYYFLPACLLFNFLGGEGVPQNKEYALESLEEISYGTNGEVLNKTAAYIYAYCLEKDGKKQDSQRILQQLREDGFSPAFMTQGDYKIFNNDLNSGFASYTKAAELKNEFAKLRLNFFKYHKRNHFWKLVQIFHGFMPTIRVLKSGALGVNCLYLDFYNVSAWFKMK